MHEKLDLATVGRSNMATSRCFTPPGCRRADRPGQRRGQGAEPVGERAGDWADRGGGVQREGSLSADNGTRCIDCRSALARDCNLPDTSSVNDLTHSSECRPDQARSYRFAFLIVIPLQLKHHFVHRRRQLAEFPLRAEPQAQITRQLPLLIQADVAADFAVGEVIAFGFQAEIAQRIAPQNPGIETGGR
uniref:Uncharacterized protein n=1 Tax=Tanacetum cinerariifolium TaxID=118510 RepID=A0A699QC01_TANCI|nr:hypothetical protein [Tanacetum cinerariifolium]